MHINLIVLRLYVAARACLAGFAGFAYCFFVGDVVGAILSVAGGVLIASGLAGRYL